MFLKIAREFSCFFFFFKSASWKQFLTIGSSFSWVAKLYLVENVTQNICSTSAERMLVTVQGHHSQSPSHIVKAVFVVYITNRQVWITSLQWTACTYNFTEFLQLVITYFKTFNSNRNIHGLNYSRTLLFCYLSSWQHILSLALYILHRFSLGKSFLQIKTKKIYTVRPVRNKGLEWQLLILISSIKFS